jgi:hypothetical protein
MSINAADELPLFGEASSMMPRRDPTSIPALAGEHGMTQRSPCGPAGYGELQRVA